MITLTIDGREVQVEPGTLLYEAAKKAGIDIPIFCYHPRMKPVAACRMCLVKVEKMPKLQPACATPVAEGMVVWTTTEEVKKAQQGVLEFLLANHPLDCPICDRGGECPLQDTAFRYGPDATRFSEHKRHLDKHRPLGPLVMLDQERCIQCQRCTRFCDEIVGDPVLTLQNRGPYTVVDVAEGRTFDSIFSGNTIEMCPVGALTSRPYRFRARPWDIVQLDSICPHCPVGCNLTVTVRDVEVMRILSRENEAVDQGWLCDRGRFGYGFLSDEARLTTPLVRKDGELRPASWEEALAAVREGLAAGPVGALGGDRLSTEALFAWRRYLDRRGDSHYDWRVTGLATAIGPGPNTWIADMDDADAFLLIDSTPLDEVPVLHLRLRHRVVNERAARAVVVGPRLDVTDVPHRAVLARPGASAEALRQSLDDGSPVAEILSEAEKLVVLWDGRDPEVYRALEELIARRGDRFTGVLVTGGRTNARGAQAVGFQPGPEGLPAGGILAAAAEGRLAALVLLAADVLQDFPDGLLARRALATVPFKVVVDYFRTPTAELADVVLPLAAFTEAAGSFVNLEGRRQAFEPVVATPGGVRADWEIPLLLADEEPELRLIRRELRQAHPELDVLDRTPRGSLPPTTPAPASNVVRVPTLYHRGIAPERYLAHLKDKADTVLLHPATAAELGVAAGEEAVLVGSLGEAPVRVAVSSQVAPGFLFVGDGVPGSNAPAGLVLKALARRENAS